MHRRPLPCSISCFESADLDAKLELQVAQHLLDGALDLFGRDFCAGVGQRQGERHALLARAEVCAAIDIEQLHVGDERACLFDGLLDLAAGDLFLADEGQVALDGSIGAERLIAQLAVHAAHQCLVVQLTEVDVLAVLLFLRDLQLAVDLIGELAEDAQTLAAAVDSGADAGVQPGRSLALVGEVQTETGCQCLHGALDGEEVLFRAEGTDAEGLALVRMLAEGQFLGQIDRCHLEQTALGVALLQVVHDDVQHRRGEQGTHDGEVLADGVQDADGLAGSIIGGDVQHVQLSVGVEGQRGCLIEALCRQQALGLELLLLVVVQTAVGDGSGVQEGGHDVVVAVLTDDLLGQVGEALYVLAVQRGGNIPAAVGLHVHGELQTLQDVDHGLVRHRDTQHTADLGGGGHDVPALQRAAIGQVVFQRGDVAAVQLLDQVQSTGKAQFGRVAVHALLVAGGGVAVLAQCAAGLADGVAGEGGALKEQAGGVLIHAGVGTAHDAGQCHRLFGIADDEVVGVQGELLLIEGHDLLALVGAADVDGAARDLVQVKGVHGLAHLQQGVVGDIDHVADGAQTAQGQMALHPAGRLTHPDVTDIVCHVAGAQVGSLHLHGDGGIGIADGLVIHGGHVQGLAEDGRDLPCDAQNGLAVRAVGGDGDIEDVVIQTDHRCDVGAGDAVFGQDEQTVDLRTGEQVIVQAQLLAGAEHTVGLNALHLAGLDLDAAGQGGAIQSGGHTVAQLHVGGTGADADIVAVVAAVHHTLGQVGALLLFHLHDLTDDHLADACIQRDQLFDLKTAGEELLLQFLSRDVDIDKFF